MQGRLDPAYEDVVKSVSSIIFLSTPHRGTDLAETLNRILQVSFVTTPRKFIAELSSGSQMLQNLNEQFRHIAPKLDIVSFYETRSTNVLERKQIVCALLGLIYITIYTGRGLRWSWIKTRRCLAIRRKSQLHWTMTIVTFANTTARLILATSLFEMPFWLLLERLYRSV